MPQSDSSRIRGFFAAHSRDVTPVQLRHAAHILYVPVSTDPELTQCCSSILSEAELSRAERFKSPADSSLFIQRRAFRRFCAALSLESSEPLSQILFEETENGRPLLADEPDCWFSFSSCRFGYLGGWSRTHGMGVDIEDRSRDPGATDLARKCFSVAEARAVEGEEGRVNLGSFFQFWSLKEAALKSIGQGLPFGLNAFGFELEPSLRVVHAPTGSGGPNRFSAHLIEGIENAESCAAVVIHSA